MSKIRLTEQQLHRVIKESVKKILKESSNYGMTMEDTLAWVKRIKPQMNPKEQYKFALNILKKTALTSKSDNGPHGKILPNGDLLSLWCLYDKWTTDVLINGEIIGNINHYRWPLVITSDVVPYFDEIKSFDKNIAEIAKVSLEDYGVEYEEF